MDKNNCYICKKNIQTVNDIFHYVEFIDINSKHVIAYLCSHKCWLDLRGVGTNK
jgi:hypothetical protein